MHKFRAYCIFRFNIIVSTIKHVMKTVNHYTFKNLIIILTCFILITTSCKDECEFPGTIGGAALIIDFFDGNTTNYLVRENSSRFSKEDINIYDELGNKRAISFIVKTSEGTPKINYYRVGVLNLFENGDDLINENNKRLFIDFKNDRDTVDYAFKAKTLDCGSTFEYIKIKYNGLLIGEFNNTNTIELKINKP